ncbi:MAG: sulfite exporter TauE/SafE family protein [Clostridium sp.]|uniref:urease accessory protein UreH domain-containing protein n=1 Tax=Clostridium sp. TaxID=1506 RepID=UPI00304043F0
MSIKSTTINVENMICSSCENVIKTKLEKVNGILSVTANYKKGMVCVEYNTSLCTYSSIISTIEKSGYNISGVNTSNEKTSELLSIVGILIIGFLIIKFGQGATGFNMSSMLSSKVSYFVLFGIGILTSIHCVGMCGGIMMSQSITQSLVETKSKIKPSIMYNLGRLVSYTILGGIIGGIGTLFSISLGTKALISIIAGLFMVIMGLNIFGFKALRTFAIKLPWSSCKSNNNINNNRNPLIVGILNGLMPCGPLQTMQLYALASGSIIGGATSMFFFALGTIPLMLGFGLIANLINQNNSRKLLKLSGLIVIFLGIIMTSRGLSLIGINLMPQSNNNFSSAQNNSPNKEVTSNKAVISNGKQVVKISATRSGYSPSVVYIQKNIPTEFIVDGENITFCNNQLIISSMNVSKDLSSGENIIEFTPGDKDINYSCWMGMLKGTIKVVDDLGSITDNNINSKSTVPSDIFPTNNQNSSCH